MSCERCHGEGYIVTCIDDLCHGGDGCIHGDGEEPCPDCGGYGDDPDDYDDERDLDEY